MINTPKKQMNIQLSDFRYRRSWKKLTALLSILVIVGTIGQLILPAITMNEDTCEVAEHTHTESCYYQESPREMICSAETLGIHSHDETCYDESGQLICGLADFVVHTHDSFCYDANGNLICTLPEVAEHTHDDSCWEYSVIDAGHTHGDDCYAWQESDTPSCGQEASEEHTHGAACYELIRGELLCTGEEREPFYGELVLACGKPEVMLHSHGEDCYDTVEEAVSEPESAESQAETEPETVVETEPQAETETAAETEPQTETETAAETEPQTETETAAETEPQTEPETAAETEPQTEPETVVETEPADPVLVCTHMATESHQHSDACIVEAKVVLICTIPEHSHSEECNIEGSTDVPDETETQTETETESQPLPEALTVHTYTQTYRGEDYTITITYGDEARLPADVVLQVVELLPGSPEYEQYYAQAGQALGNENIVYARVFDVTFLADGEEVEPAASVQMEIHYDEAVTTDVDTKAQVVHFGEDGTEVLPAEKEENDDGITDISHTQDGFSVIVYTLTEENKDTGPNKLLIDWYVFLDKEWTKVGSTRTGWLAADEGVDYDHISESQAMSILEDYGFTGGATGWEDLAYRKVKTYGAEPELHSGIWSVSGETDGDGRHYYKLSTDTTVDAYCMYYIPNSGSELFDDPNGTQYSLYEKFGDQIGVYTIQVYDPDHVNYDEGETLPYFHGVWGTNVDITIKAATNEENRWCLSRPSLVGVRELQADEIVENGDGTIFFTLTVDQSLYITPHSVHATAGSIPPDDLTVRYWVYLDGAWHHVGTTYTGWTIAGRDAAGEEPYKDPNYEEGSGSKPSTLDRDNGYTRDVISVSQIESILGKFGYSPTVPVEFTGPTSPQQSEYRAQTLGYQRLYKNGQIETAENKNTVFSDTYYDVWNGVLVYPLTKPLEDGGQYNIYYIPDGTGATSYKTGESAIVDMAAMGRKDVNFYVHLDGTWINVGTAHYYNPASSTQDDGRDQIGLSLLLQYLGPYGFTENSLNDTKALFYSAVSNGTTKYYNDTGVVLKSYQLTYKANSPSSYNIYYLPGYETEQGGGLTAAELTTLAANNLSGTFLLFQVYEPSRSVYDSLAAMPKAYVRYGKTGKLIVKQVPSTGGHGVTDWVVKGLDRSKILSEKTEENPDGYYSRVDNGDGTWTYTIDSMTETAIVAFPYSNGDRSLSNNYSNSNHSASMAGVVADPNIQFTLHNYSTRINELLRERGLASFTGGVTETETEIVSGETRYVGADLEQTYFSFRGAGGNGVSYSPYLDNDPFQRNHATVKRNLEYDEITDQGYPVLDITHHGYTTAENLRTYAGFTDEDIAAWEDAQNKDLSLGFLFGKDAKETEELDANGEARVTQIAAGDGSPAYVINYVDVVNTPLQIVNGKYQYFSYFNAADFNTAEQKWYVRDYVERTESTSSYLTKDDYGDFLPFNHSGGELLHGRNYNFYTEDVDYWYGMTMRAKFYMPENGETTSGAMMFSFAGDDDVYVFIDDMLVLDIGGTHGSCSGFINFQTGLVSAYYDFNGETAGEFNLIGSVFSSYTDDPYDTQDYMRFYSTTIYEEYKKALEEKGLSDAEVQAKLDEIFVKVEGETVKDFWARLKEESYDANSKVQKAWVKAWMIQNNITWDDASSFTADNWSKAAAAIQRGQTFDVYRFRDYTTHDLDYFYMERGSSVANCNIQFNLPTLPPEELTIAKELDYVITDPTEDDKEFYTTGEKHSFRIINTETGEPLKMSLEYEYEVTTSDGKSAGTVKADKNGVFRITAGQRVTVPDINAWLYADNSAESYTVQELIPVVGNEDPAEIKINGNSVQVDEKKVTIGDGNVEYWTYSRTVTTANSGQELLFTPYTNIRDLTNAGYLVIGKDTGNLDSKDQLFSVEVKINGNLVPKDTKFYRLNANGEIISTQDFVRADENGVIKIKGGEKYRMGARLVPGYTFTVAETAYPEGWSLNEYTVDGNVRPKTHPAAGKIENDKTHEVMVYNVSAAVNLTVPLSKQFLGMDGTDDWPRTAEFTITQVEPVSSGDKTTFVAVADPIHQVADVTVTCIGKSTSKAEIKLDYPENTPNGTYYYLVKEDSVTVQPGETFLKDTSQYIVRVDIFTSAEKQVAQISAIYKNGVLIHGTDDDETVENGPTILTFVNRKGGYELPATGGSGISSYRFSGFAMIMAASLIYAHLCKKKRREEAV